MGRESLDERRGEDEEVVEMEEEVDDREGDEEETTTAFVEMSLG